MFKKINITSNGQLYSYVATSVTLKLLLVIKTIANKMYQSLFLPKFLVSILEKQPQLITTIIFERQTNHKSAVNKPSKSTS